MNTDKQIELRSAISGKVRLLRESRSWTQAELCKRLGLSQSRLSEIERGQGSFSAEQFLEILKLFNVPVTHFATERKPESELQNALARLGATHLQERADVLPSSVHDELEGVVIEVLVTAESPRYITSLAPVIVQNINRINLQKALLRLAELGAERRLGWLLENTLTAIRQALARELPRKWTLLYRRAELILETWLANWHLPKQRKRLDDVLDRDIITEKTLNEVKASRSRISHRWGIATSIQLDDFVEALRMSRASD